MAISYKTFQQFVSDMISRWQGDTGITAVLVSGDPLLAAFDSGATEFVYIENLLQQVVLQSRLSTSSGNDVDTFLADFGLTRLPAVLSSGQVLFATATPATTQVQIPAGTIVQTLGGAIQYQVIGDTTQSGWNASLNAYVIPAGQSQVIAAVQALVAGSISNVQANLLVQMGSAVSGVATVNNPVAITNGLDAETDAAAKARFVMFFASLSEATEAAILFAIASVQQGLDIVLLENQTPSLQTQYGFFTVVIDDGSGNPPTSLLEAISTAVNNVRAFTIAFTVIGPSLLANTPIVMSITSLNPTVSIPLVQAAVIAYTNSLSIGEPLNVSRLIAIALGADPVNMQDVDVTSVLINGENEDLVPTGVQEIRTSASYVTIES